MSTEKANSAVNNDLDLEKEYYKYACEFVRSELEHGFPRLDKAHKSFLDSYVVDVINKFNTLIPGFSGTPLCHGIVEELRLATRVGYSVHSAYSRFSVSSPEFEKYMIDKNKLTVRKVINNILDSLKLK